MVGEPAGVTSVGIGWQPGSCHIDCGLDFAFILYITVTPKRGTQFKSLKASIKTAYNSHPEE